MQRSVSLGVLALGSLAVIASCSREPRSRPYAEIEAEQQARIAAEQARRDAQSEADATFAASALDDPASIDPASLPESERDAEARRRLALMEQAMAGSDVGVDGSGTGATREETNPWITYAPETPVGQTHATPEPEFVATPAPTPAPVVENPQATIVADAPADAVLSEDDRVRLAADPLVRTLRDEALAADSPVEAMLRLAAMESVQADALPASDIAGDAPMRTLSDEERTLIEAWRDLHAGTRDEATAGDVAALSRLLTDAADRVRGLQPLAISRAALCTRVERFGVYDELPIYEGGTHKMIAGRPQRVLMYLELENFAHRPDTQGSTEGWSVDLTVGLTLHHLGRQTDLLAWRMSEETVRVFSRNHRREFFLSIVADLPASISVDSYALKAVVRDENSGATAERVLRIDMVADASALVSGAE
jgi:hypothetical protein